MGRETITDDAVVGGQPAKTLYDARGNVTKSWSEGVPAYDEVRSNRTDYDVFGRQITIYEPGTTSVASTFTYCADGEVLRETRADGSWTEYTYDDGGNKVSEKSPDGFGGYAISDFAYDIGGRLVAETDADGAVTTHAYDALGRETAATGEGPASNVVYSATGNVISKTDADGVKTESVFDSSGRTTREVVVAAGGKTRTTTTAYDETGKVLVTTDPDSKRIDNEYDVLGRAIKETHTTDLGPVKREARSFDSLGRTETTTDEIAGVTRAFSYANGTPGATTLRTSYAGVVTTTTVGTDGREASRVSDLLGVSVTRSSGASDTAGRETGWSVGNTSYSRTFNGAGQLTGWSAGSIASGSLSYDAAARKNRDQMSSALLASIEQTYTYTDEGRLASVKPSGVATTTYAFDSAGNLTTETASASTVMSYDTATTQRLINRKVGGSVIATYTFDAFGQRIAQGPVSNPTSETFGYTGTGRLASYVASSVVATYTYDASGQRTQSAVSQGSLTTTTTYTYEGLSLLSLAAEKPRARGLSLLVGLLLLPLALIAAITVIGRWVFVAAGLWFGMAGLTLASLFTGAAFLSIGLLVSPFLGRIRLPLLAVPLLISASYLLTTVLGPATYVGIMPIGMGLVPAEFGIMVDSALLMVCYLVYCLGLLLRSRL